MPYLSVCIPTYEMTGLGRQYLRQSFENLVTQRFRDFEVVISDHSLGPAIEELCGEYRDRLEILYLRNPHDRGSSSANLNHAIRHASGKLIKVLFQDDFLAGPDALRQIVDAFDLTRDRWLVTGSEHTRDGRTFYRPFHPSYNDRIHLGKNTISSPSVLTIKNDRPLLFDEKLIWLMDCEYYKRCYEAFGPPKIVPDVNVVNRTGRHQVSATLATRRLQRREREYVRRKFDPLQLPDVTLVAVSSVKIPSTLHALTYSMRGIRFGRVLLVSDTRPSKLPDGVEFAAGPPLRSLDDYSRFMLYGLAEHIKTEFALVVQHDGYVVRPQRWDRRFLDYDYIGAPWRRNAHFSPEGVNIRIGNGGFSLRSQRTLNAPKDLGLPFTDNGTGYLNEDGILCNYFRKRLEDHGIRYAPPALAARFSSEENCEETVADPFGFHKNTGAMPRSLFWAQTIKRMVGLV